MTAGRQGRHQALYRFWHEDGQLLYVGITGNLPSRMEAHAADKPWWSEVASITVEHFNDRETVEAAERRAIVMEDPILNVTHSLISERGGLTARQAADRDRLAEGIRWLRERREACPSGATADEIVKTLTAIVDGAEGRDLTDEEAERYERLEDDLAVARRRS